MRARDLEVPAGAGAEYGLRTGVVGIGPGRGDVREDHSPAALAVGIAHVRDTAWLPRAFTETEVPRAVAQTFARGGRNFQRTHDCGAERMTAEIWLRERLADDAGGLAGVLRDPASVTE